MSGYQNYTSRTYLAEHYVREKHILTIFRKESGYPSFIFTDENGTEYYYEAKCLPVRTEQGWVDEPITMFGKWAMSCSIGESIYVSFYIANTSQGNEIFDVRINKKRANLI